MVFPIDAALYGESDDFVFEGTAFLVSGWDHSASPASDPAFDTTGPVVPGIQTRGSAEKVADALTGFQMNNVIGRSPYPSIESVGPRPDLASLAREYRRHADLVMPGGSGADHGTWWETGSPRVIYVEGDLEPGGQRGQGILVVEGDLRAEYGLHWRGLVVVLGDLDIDTGGNRFRILGSLLVAGDRGPQGLHGNIDILYSSEALHRLEVLEEGRPFFPVLEITGPERP